MKQYMNQKKVSIFSVSWQMEQEKKNLYNDIDAFRVTNIRTPCRDVEASKIFDRTHPKSIKAPTHVILLFQCYSFMQIPKNKNEERVRDLVSFQTKHDFL